MNNLLKHTDRCFVLSLMALFFVFGGMTFNAAETAATSDKEKANQKANPPVKGAPGEEEKDLLSHFDVKWQKGPGVANLESRAQIQLPAGYVFVDGEGTRKVLEEMGNLTSGNEAGFLAPTSMVWFVIFRFSADGYVKDDDKDKLDAQKMLKVISEGVEESNEERRKRGFPEMKVLGWEQPPHYDSETHNLEWALIGEGGGERIINYNTRLLGRRGVMEAKLVVEPDQLSSTLPQFKKLLADFEYKSGERYAEYRQGDKMASYGLAALVTGGAVAVAAKTGLLAGLAAFFKKGFKLIIAAVVAVVAGIKKLLFGRSSKTIDE